MPFIDPWFHQFLQWNILPYVFILTGARPSVEIASLTMWLISYICIIVCTLNDFKTSVNNTLWGGWAHSVQSIRKGKYPSKKLQLRVYQTKNFVCAFVYLGYVSD